MLRRIYGLLALYAVLGSVLNAAETRYAVLVGIEDYEHADLRSPPLKYAVDDAQELGEVLTAAGYQVVLLTDDTGQADPKRKPTRANIDAAIRAVLAKCSRGDTVLLAFAGHGLQFAGSEEQDAYFCPADARPFAEKRESLVSFKQIYKELEASFAGTKLILVDACRNDPDPTRGRDALAADRVQPPRGVGALFSCSPGQRAFENDSLKHGIFFYHVIEKLRAGGPLGVSFNALGDHVGILVPQQALAFSNRQQTPNQQGNLFGVPMLIPPSSSEASPAQTLTNSIGMKLRLIPAGSFQMGSSQAQIEQAVALDSRLDASNFANEQPQHRVEISRAFNLGTTEVTRGQFSQFVAATGYRTEAETDGEGGHGYNRVDRKFEGPLPKYTWRETGFPQTNDHPVVNVSWNDAVAFCNWLSTREGLDYHLPTEAQWEYACRAGSSTGWSFGSDERELVQNANVADQQLKLIPGAGKDWYYHASSDGFPFTAPVGRFPTNLRALFDLHGNVLEWCADCYGAEYYAEPIDRDPLGPSKGNARALRGGSWTGGPAYTRSAFRGSEAPTKRMINIGFRIAKTK